MSFCSRGHDLTIRGVYKNSQCKVCSKIKHRLYYKQFKDQINKGVRKRLQENKQLILDAKSRPCADCGISYPTWIMQFDHLKDKKYHVSQMLSSQYSIKTIKAEVEKCEIVCANCHANRTYQRRVSIRHTSNAV